MSSITAPLVPTTPRLGRGPVVAVAVVGALAVGTVIGTHLVGTGTSPTTARPTTASGPVTGVAPGSVRTGAQAEAHAFGKRAAADEAAVAAATGRRQLSVWAARTRGAVAASQVGGAASLKIDGEDVRRLHLSGSPESISAAVAAEASPEDSRRMNLHR